MIDIDIDMPEIMPDDEMGDDFMFESLVKPKEAEPEPIPEQAVLEEADQLMMQDEEVKAVESIAQDMAPAQKKPERNETIMHEEESKQ